jgi:ferritin-like metal-binding protein YciE
MGKMAMNNLRDLLEHELSDLHDAEHQILDALPRVIDAAKSDKLREALRHHEKLTRGHVTRLDEVFKIMEMKPSGERCKGMAGLLEEASAVVKADGEPATKDAAIISAAQRVEHYEIAGYGSARTFAKALGNIDAAEILQRTLEEEGQADNKLSHIAEYTVNLQAAGLEPAAQFA